MKKRGFTRRKERGNPWKTLETPPKPQKFPHNEWKNPRIPTENAQSKKFVRKTLLVLRKPDNNILGKTLETLEKSLETPTHTEEILGKKPGPPRAATRVAESPRETPRADSLFRPTNIEVILGKSTENPDCRELNARSPRAAHRVRREPPRVAES